MTHRTKFLVVSVGVLLQILVGTELTYHKQILLQLVKNKDVNSNKPVLTLKIRDITVQEQQKVALFHLMVLGNVVMLILNLIHAAI